MGKEGQKLESSLIGGYVNLKSGQVNQSPALGLVVLSLSAFALCSVSQQTLASQHPLCRVGKPQGSSGEWLQASPACGAQPARLAGEGPSGGDSASLQTLDGERAGPLSGILCSEPRQPAAQVFCALQSNQQRGPTLLASSLCMKEPLIPSKGERAGCGDLTEPAVGEVKPWGAKKLRGLVWG